MILQFIPIKQLVYLGRWRMTSLNENGSWILSKQKWQITHYRTEEIEIPKGCHFFSPTCRWLAKLYYISWSDVKLCVCVTVEQLLSSDLKAVGKLLFCWLIMTFLAYDMRKHKLVPCFSTRVPWSLRVPHMSANGSARHRKKITKYKMTQNLVRLHPRNTDQQILCVHSIKWGSVSEIGMLVRGSAAVEG